MITKLLAIVSLFLVSIYIAPTHALAASNFTTDYKVTYTIDESGITHAVINASLTNASSQFYASSYKMQIGFDTISNVKAQDIGGAITPVVLKNEDGYVVELTFNKKAVGLGSKQDFAIMFDTPKLARHYGKIWEIDIPGIANPQDFTNFVVDLKVPLSFGQAAFTKPQQPGNSLTFTKETLGKSGISIAFGDKQVYKFNLSYHLRNPNLYPKTMEIALPPSTNYQDSFITNIDPKPINVTQDKDGNWMAQYKLSSAQKLDILVEGNAEVNLNPKPVELSPIEQEAYLGQKKYWESDDDRIREIADNLKTPEAIYAYVVNTLKYDFKRVKNDQPRLGALGALQNPNSAVCREFTDLFIALARAAKIPARQVEGYAYTENVKQRPLSLEKDILHVWPEYYSTEKKKWVMIDPTWGSTTGGVDYFNVLDFAHFAFVIKGLDSELPLPAGGYKFSEDEVSKDVQVEFTTNYAPSKKTFAIESTIPQLTIAGLPIKGNILVKNTGSAYLAPQIVYLTSPTFLPGTQTLSLPGIPPFGEAQVAVSFKPTSFLTNTQGDYTILVAGVSKVKSVKAAPFYATPMGGGILIGLLAFIILITTIKSRRLRLSRRK